MTSNLEKAIIDIYTNPNEAGSFGGIEALFRACRAKGLNVSREDIKNALKKEKVYTLYRTRRIRYSRNPTFVNDIDVQWQADLADMQKVSRQNNGFHYILVVIDCFSKYVWCVPVKKKDSTNMVIAFTKLFKESYPRIPKRLQTDKGKEFLNKPLQDLFKKFKINHFVTQNETKASMAERVIRTLKTKIYRWFDHTNGKSYVNALDKIVKAYNSSYHRTIGMKPIEVKKKDVERLWQRVYGKHLIKGQTKPKFTKDEPIRISSAKTIFDKGYLPNWSEEVFKISDKVDHPRKVYKIEDLDGEKIKGTFYPEELQKVSYTFPKEFVIEKILNTRTRKGISEKLIKWRGYPERFNSWIPETDLTKYAGR